MEARAQKWEQLYIEISVEVRRVHDKQDARYDQLLEQRLCTGKKEEKIDYKPIQVRKPWSQVQIEFERRDKEKYWKEKIKEVEERDRGSMNKMAAGD